MGIEEENAGKALDMFCRAAEKETGDIWEIQKMENGNLAVVQTFISAKKAKEDPEIPDEEKKLLITGAIFCMTSGGFAELAGALVRTFSNGPLDFAATPDPLPFLRGCSSVEEMALKLAACS